MRPLAMATSFFIHMYLFMNVFGRHELFSDGNLMSSLERYTKVFYSGTIQALLRAYEGSFKALQ